MYTISAYAQIWEMPSSECNIDRFALLNRASSSSIRGPDDSMHEVCQAARPRRLRCLVFPGGGGGAS